MRHAALFLLLWLVAACAVPQQSGLSDPLLFDQSAMARAGSAVVGIPGALTSVRVLSALDELETVDRAIAYYRLPGYDGRPEAEWVDIDRAAARISRLVQEMELERIYLVGHSTGAVIALEAAKAIRRSSPQVQVSVYAISTALPAPQPLFAGMRGAAGTVAAAARAGSLDPRTVWLEYYRRLAYGPNAQTNPQVAEAADALVAANDARIELPRKGLGRRHTRDLRRWTNPAPEDLEGVRLEFYHGAVDPVFPPEITARFVATLPNARLRLIEGHGHLLLLTYPEIWDLITARIARADGPSGTR